MMQPIRDPNPIHDLDAIVENPFSDPVWRDPFHPNLNASAVPTTTIPRRKQRESSSTRSTIDEDGRVLDKSDSRQTPSQSSVLTASSSILDAKIQNWQVVQRFQDISESGSNASPLFDRDSELNSIESSSVLEQTPLMPDSARSGSIVWAGQDATPTIDRDRSLSLVETKPLESQTPTNPLQKRQLPNVQSGVRKLVEVYERKATNLDSDTTKRTRTKSSMVIGLAPREHLFVANPDN